MSSPWMGSIGWAALAVTLITQPYAKASSWAQDEAPQASHKPAHSEETRDTSSWLPAGQVEKYSTAVKPESADEQNTSPVFAQRELHRRRAHLAEAELRLQRFKQDNSVFSLKDQRRLLLEQHTALSTSLKTILNQAAGFREKLNWLRSRKSTLEETIPLSTLTDQQRMLDEAKEEQLRLQLKEQELLMKFQEDNRQVRTTRREIDLVGAFIADQEKRLQKHVTTGKNPVYLELELELLRTEA